MSNNIIQIDMKKTGDRLKKLCEEKSITVRNIQDELGIGAFQSVYNWFKGKSLPSLDNMYRLSRLLNVPMEKIIVDNVKIIFADWVQWDNIVPKHLFTYHEKIREKMYSVTN